MEFSWLLTNHDEIETMVNQARLMPRNKQIAKWQSSIFDFIKTLNEEMSLLTRAVRTINHANMYNLCCEVET